MRPALGSLGEAVLIDAIQRMKPAVSRDGRVSEAELQSTQAVLRLNGFLRRDFALADVFDGSFLGA